MNGKELKGKAIKVQKFLSRGELKTSGAKFTNVLIRNLPADFTEDQLEEHFGKCGEIKSKKIENKE